MASMVHRYHEHNSCYNDSYIIDQRRQHVAQLMGETDAAPFATVTAMPANSMLKIDKFWPLLAEMSLSGNPALSQMVLNMSQCGSAKLYDLFAAAMKSQQKSIRRLAPRRLAGPGLSRLPAEVCAKISASLTFADLCRYSVSSPAAYDDTELLFDVQNKFRKTQVVLPGLTMSENFSSLKHEAQSQSLVAVLAFLSLSSSQLGKNYEFLNRVVLTISARDSGFSLNTIRDAMPLARPKSFVVMADWPGFNGPLGRWGQGEVPQLVKVIDMRAILHLREDGSAEIHSACALAEDHRFLDVLPPRPTPRTF